MRRQRMAQAAQERQGRRVAREVDIPVPIRGVLSDAAGSIVSSQFAAKLLNWRSTGTRLEMRKQSKLWTSEGADINQVIPYEFGGTYNEIRVLSDRLQYLGADTLIGSAIDAPVYSAEISSSVIVSIRGRQIVRFLADTIAGGSGFSYIKNPGDAQATGFSADGVMAHHDRLYFWRTYEGLEFFYGDVGAVQGLVTRFPLDRLGNLTGEVAALISMTVDAGHGMNDMLVVMTSTGDTIFYEGLDPGDPQDWRMVGRLKLAAPLGPSSWANIAGDVWVVTKAGLISLADSLQKGRLALAGEYSRPVRALMEPFLFSRKWQVHVSADGTMVIANYPGADGSLQFIYYTESQSWATADYPAVWWFNGQQETRFVTPDGDVRQIVGERTVDVGEGTDTITAVWHSAWLETGTGRAVTYIRPRILATGPLTVRLQVLTDQDETTADLAEALQEVTLQPERPGAQVMLDEAIPVDAPGSSFQVRMEVTAPWAKLMSCKAGIL